VALLGQAKQYATGDEELLAVIAKVQEPPEKTAVRGHHGYYGGYYDRPYHHRHFDCTWFVYATTMAAVKWCAVNSTILL